jgi:hypothetical protein
MSIAEPVVAVDGDASTYLEELIVGELPPLVPSSGEMVGSLPGSRLSPDPSERDSRV